MSEPAYRVAWRRILAARRDAQGGPMDVKRLESMPGMPAGFPFAMVLIGIALAIVGPIFMTIDARFFLATGAGFGNLGHELLKWGAVLQGVVWIVAAFGRRSPPPPP